MAGLRWSGNLLSALAGALATAAAADGPRPVAEGTLELEDEWVFQASDPEAELNDALATLDLDAALLWPGGSGLYATVVAEPVRDPERDRFFGDTGIFVEELYLQLHAAGATLRAGKFTPLFGLIAEREPGLYGDELAGDYELSERIGIEAALPYRAFGTDHVLTAATFIADRTALGGSLFTARERLRRGAGGVSNTPGPGSFALSSTGGTGATAWTAGIRYQGAGEGDEADEYGAVLGLDHRVALWGRPVGLTAELAHFPRFDGEHARATLLTLGAGIGIGGAWITLYAGAGGGPAAPIQRFAAAAVELPLAEDVTIAAGYRFLDEDEAQSHTLGLRLTYEFGFD